MTMSGAQTFVYRTFVPDIHRVVVALFTSCREGVFSETELPVNELSRKLINLLKQREPSICARLSLLLGLYEPLLRYFIVGQKNTGSHQGSLSRKARDRVCRGPHRLVRRLHP